MSALLVFTNLPDRESADRIARAVVDARIAACVNVLAPARSVYRWKGTVETAEEIPMLIKTTEERYLDLEKTLRELHPYELPEIVALRIDGGLPAYLEWVAAESQPVVS